MRAVTVTFWYVLPSTVQFSAKTGVIINAKQSIRIFMGRIPLFFRRKNKNKSAKSYAKFIQGNRSLGRDSPRIWAERLPFENGPQIDPSSPCRQSGHQSPTTPNDRGWNSRSWPSNRLQDENIL
jgi:hypothetical protein